MATETIRRLERCTAELEHIAGVPGNVVLNFHSLTYEFAGSPRNAWDIELFAGRAQRAGGLLGGPEYSALSRARFHAENDDNEGHPKADYLGTILLRPDGTWSPVDLFPQTVERGQ